MYGRALSFLVVRVRAWSCAYRNANARVTGTKTVWVLLLNRRRSITFYAAYLHELGVFVVVQIQDQLERVHER